MNAPSGTEQGGGGSRSHSVSTTSVWDACRSTISEEEVTDCRRPFRNSSNCGSTSVNT